MIAVAGVLTGYNGSFEFKEPGQKYEDTPYVGMRVVRGGEGRGGGRWGGEGRGCASSPPSTVVVLQ